MKLTKYAQSCFLVESNGKRILIDPGSFCYEGDFTPMRWSDIDLLLLTHKHSDHCDTEAVKIISENCQPIIITNQEVHDLLNEHDVKSEVLEPDDFKKFDNVTIYGIKSVHGYLPDGSRKPDVLGFLINDKFYHPGDTIYLEDKPFAQVVAVPICGRVVMDIWDAARFCKEIGSEIVIPMHYDNPKFPVDINDFEKEMEGAGIKVKVLNDGESIDL